VLYWNNLRHFTLISNFCTEQVGTVLDTLEDLYVGGTQLSGVVCVCIF